MTSRTLALFDTWAIWPSVEKTTKPDKTDVAQLIVLVINASLWMNGKEFYRDVIKTIFEIWYLPITIIMKFIVRRQGHQYTETRTQWKKYLSRSFIPNLHARKKRPMFRSDFHINSSLSYVSMIPYQVLDNT